MLTRHEILRRAFSEEFIQGMRDRMVVGVFKYGFPDTTIKVDRPESILARLEKYRQTGNTEFLMDIANFCMIEFMLPQHPRAHFASTDSDQSPGLRDSKQTPLHTMEETKGELSEDA